MPPGSPHGPFTRFIHASRFRTTPSLPYKRRLPLGVLHLTTRTAQRARVALPHSVPRSAQRRPPVQQSRTRRHPSLLSPVRLLLVQWPGVRGELPCSRGGVIDHAVWPSWGDHESLGVRVHWSNGALAARAGKGRCRTGRENTDVLAGLCSRSMLVHSSSETRHHPRRSRGLLVHRYAVATGHGRI